MSWLFVVENKVVKPNIETLIVSPFREIWERDTHPSKFTAMDEFAYIEFMVSLKRTNPYRAYDPETRHERLCKDIMKHDSYEPDELVVEAMKVLEDFQLNSSISMSYFLAAKKAVKSIQDFFNDPDILKMTNPRSGLPLYKPKDITNAVIDTEKVLNNLVTLEEKVNNEIFETVKNKGQKTVSIFADRDTL